MFGQTLGDLVVLFITVVLILLICWALTRRRRR